MRRVGVRLLEMVLLAVLIGAGCSRTNVPPGFVDELRQVAPGEFSCCEAPEKFYPPQLMELVLPIFDAFGPGVSTAYAGLREDTPHPGRLTGNPAAMEAVVRRLEPFDMFFIANKSHPQGRMIPGRFSHSYIYAGTETELRALGLWSLPALAPYRDDIREGRFLIEAVAPLTRTAPPELALDVDAAVILRPHLTQAQRRLALERMFGAVGTPYDFNFAAGRPGRFSCTGLNDAVYPHLRFTRRQAYGETVILPDDVVAQAIRGEGMRVVAYVVGTEEGFQLRNIHSLMGDIAAYWGLPD